MNDTSTRGPSAGRGGPMVPGAGQGFSLPWKWKVRIKRVVPPRLLNQMLLSMPFLYRLRAVNYESQLEDAGLSDLGQLLDMSLEVPGEIVECGSSRCGTSAIIANYLLSRGVKKTVYACDTFEGFRAEEFIREKQLGHATVPDGLFTSTSIQYVKRKLQRLGLADRVIPVKGTFQATFPDLIRKLPCVALVLVDCDLEESMWYCAQTLFPLMSPGGVMAFDDYESADFKGVRAAVERFTAVFSSQIESHGLMNRLYFARKARP